ncbi:MAG TPA: chromosome segregation protein SMC [Azospirillaceae bacterium]|nr:chromosome segregation protein SMC [Azospirillaceae bacterium]
MQFTRLRLSGFKSFVDPTELLIEPGTTGIVGPNGCGKSNLVEALRWVMGETSARRMRGEEMDDVIFGGTTARPARNVAEVVLTVDNRRRLAPAAFNNEDELEISRRIERGAGSDYRVNGKLVRARDVQILFADAATGASSAALVSQGRVGALINAKPSERRALLEEAAGVAGLHTRRHEAELKLRAAEQNLTRLDDIIRTLEGQLKALKTQARQASRYRNVQEQVRRADAMLLILRWDAAEAAETAARRAFAEADGHVATLMAEVARTATVRTEAAGGLPELRKAEVEASAALQRLRVAKEQLDAEERRVADARAQAERRLAQAKGDLGREASLAADATAALGRLADERDRLVAAQGNEAEAEAAARNVLAETRDAVDGLERELQRLTEEVAAAEARRGTLQRASQELGQRLTQLTRRRDELDRDRSRLAADEAARPDLAAAEAAVVAAEGALASAKAEAEAADKVRLAADTGQIKAREVLQQAEAARSRLRAEADGLRSLLRSAARDAFPPLIDAVRVAPGFEAAFAAALGDDLTAPLDAKAPVHWNALPPYDAPPPLPAGAQPLAPHVEAPDALARALGLIGLVEDAAMGERLASDLRPGQVLVTADGAAWRWDGLVVRAGAPTQAALRLQQKNRLAELEKQLAGADARAAEAKAAADQARIAASEAAARDAQARDSVRRAFDAVNAAKDRRAKLAQAADATATRLAAIDEAIGRVASEAAEMEERLAEARTSEAALPDISAARQTVGEVRTRLAEKRAGQATAQADLDRLTREAQARRQRLAAIAQEEASWRTRSEGAAGRVAELEARIQATEDELRALSGRPAEIETERQALVGRIGVAERARGRAAEALAAAEAASSEVEKRLRTAESGLAEAREVRARAEGAVAQTMQAKEALRERIAERVQVPPQALRNAAGLAPDEALPPAAEVEARLERLLREREALGAVNLLAEQEAQELEVQVAGMHTEREDLVAAIGRLRQAIQHLNREARERLASSFETVDRHFQDLFTRLFGGGKAHLKLVEGDDPLNSGLEIYASPPGKKLQVLSLLSGGEQALTAIALLFAVFLTNPAPICVLDEVDAPLDEANVDRFCSLVDEMAKADRTRFLVVTHHRMTMARMDRLFGVTMMERGVSQLVSVDLRGAVRMAAE